MESAKGKATAYLTQIYGETTNRKFKLKCSKVTIGRSFHAEIRLHNPNISRTHCTLNYSNNGWTVTDNASQNGTYISGRKLKPGEARLLQCGDIIFLGPPSEMPEAFCYDDAFIDDEHILETGHEIIELPLVKRPAENEITASKKSLKHKNSGVEILSIKKECIKETADLLEFKRIDHSLKYKGEMVNKKDTLLPKDEISETIKSLKNFESSPKLNDPDISSQTSLHVQHKTPSFVHSPPSKQSKLDDSGYQIHEISSTGVDQAEDSLSLLDLEKNEVFEPCSSGFSENKNGCLQESTFPKESDILKSKLALMSERIKKLEQSKLDLLKNYEIVCEKNFSLDQELSEKKKLEEELKSCEQNLKNKLKNELLEKFEEDLICNICTELLIKPTVLDCSHTFCLHCIKEWKKKKNECPMCRHKIQTITPVLTLEHFIDKALSTLTPDQKERRNQLIKDRENPPKKDVTPTSRRHRARSRGRFRRRNLSNINRFLNTETNRGDVQIIGERRNNVIPGPVQIPNLFLRLPHVRIPRMLLDNEGDSIDVYIA